MSKLSVAEIYHEATKYTPQGLQVRIAPLDLENSPSNCKDRVSETLIPLAPHQEVPKPEAGAALSQDQLGWLLAMSNGVTAVFEGIADPDEGVQRLELRAAPSAGALYPTEIYLASGGGTVPTGLYNFRVSENALEPLFETDLREALARAVRVHDELAGADLIFVFSSVFERSAWRYEDRAYRRVLLDTGHVLGNMSIAARALGLELVVIGGFCDDDVNRALLVDHHLEGALALAWLRPLGEPAMSPSDLSLASLADSLRSRPNTSLMRHLHRASAILSLADAQVLMDMPAEQSRLGPSAAEGTKSALPKARGEALESIERVSELIRRRRSARGFATEAVSLAELSEVLASAEAASGLMAAELTRTYVIAHAVSELAPGCYELLARSHELRLCRAGECREKAAAACLGQELARDAAFIVVHVTQLPRAVARLGDRAYRYLHLDAGQRGQHMSLTALSLELGASGIAGFFDEDLAELLGLSPDDIVLYLTVIGRLA